MEGVRTMVSILIPVHRKVLAINMIGFVLLFLFFLVLGWSVGSRQQFTLAECIALTMFAALVAIIGWQLRCNLATFDGDELVLRAGFYKQHWPVTVLEAPWKERRLDEFDRKNGVGAYKYFAGRFSFSGVDDCFMLAINSDLVRCLNINGYPALCLDANTHSLILAAKP